MPRGTPKTKRQERLAVKQLDQVLQSYKTLPPGPAQRGGWIRAIRTALGMSTSQYARRLGLTRARAYQLEDNELRGSLKLTTLARAARALNCRLVYAFVPETSLEQIIEEQAQSKVLRRMRKIDASMGLEAQRVSPPELDAQVEELTREMVLLRPKDLWD